MNILLVQAYLGKTEPPVFPLGLSCLASSVTGHNVKVFDPNVSGNAVSELTDILGNFRPDIIGISLRNIDSTNKRKVIFYYPYLKKMIDTVKDGLCRNSRIIVGGSGFSMFAQEIMRDEQRIDYGVFLEGENTFPKLIENLERPDTVKGVFYRRGGEVLFTGLNEQVDLTTVALPDRAITSIYPYLNVPDAIGVETKRGCMLGCVYCIYGFLNGKNLRLKEPVRVVNEIEFMVKNMKVKRFTFVDSVFNHPLSHAEAICNEVIKRGIEVSWSAWFHEEYMTEKFVSLVKAAGCNKVILSPDGFSDTTLYNLGKTLKKKDILKVYDMLKDCNGIEICYNFFKNPQGQDLLAFLSLMWFCVRAKFRLKRRVHFEFNSIRIEPHTRLYKLALEQGMVDKDSTLLYPRYYSNPNTQYIEKIFNLVLRLKGA